MPGCTFCVPDIDSQITEAHLISAGSALRMADAVINGEVRNGFAIVRPPGHHSMTVVHGNRGFCNINNEAIMIEYLRRKYGMKRIAIVDTDVHHGDGTQEIFWDDPRRLVYIFSSGWPHPLPGQRFYGREWRSIGLWDHHQYPLAPRTTDEGILFILDNLVMPILEEFKPDLVINSAGQDNHYSDPLANMCFTAQGYAKLNRRLNPDIAVLEGGYSVESALPYINMGLIMAMAGIDFSNLKEPDYSPEQFKEPRGNHEALERIVNTQLRVFREREEKIAQARAKEQRPFRMEMRNIFMTLIIFTKRSRWNCVCARTAWGSRSLCHQPGYPSGEYYNVACIHTSAWLQKLPGRRPVRLSNPAKGQISAGIPAEQG